MHKRIEGLHSPLFPTTILPKTRQNKSNEYVSRKYFTKVDNGGFLETKTHIDNSYPCFFFTFVHREYLQIWCLWRKPFRIVALIFQWHFEITSNNCWSCGSTRRDLKSHITEFVHKIYVCVTKFSRNNCFKTLFRVKVSELSPDETTLTLTLS